MTGLKIGAGVLLVLFLLSLVRLGGEAEYSEEGLLVKVRVGLFRFQVFPFKKKEKPPKPEKKKASEPQKGETEPEKEQKPKRGGPLELVKQFLPLACEAAGELKRKIRIDKLYLDLVVAASNAAGTAMAYGYANMVLGMLWPLVEQNFEVKDPEIHTGVDFTTQSPTVYILAAFSVRLGQLVSFGLRFGWKFIRIYLKNRPKSTQEYHKNPERGDLT